MANAAFTALRNSVYDITNRADLVAETSLAVRAATLKLHHSDFYPRDLAESRVQFLTADYFQSLAYKQLFPDFRAISYIRKVDDNVPTKMLDVISPTDIFDSYNIAKEDVCYLAGEVIQIRSLTAITEILLGYYKNPPTTEDTYASWVYDLYPDAVIVEAAAQVFRMIGAAEQAQMYDRMAREYALMVRNSNISAEGF